MERAINFNLNKNSIVCGDCCNEKGKGWLNSIPENSIDLIYIDPPFFSNKNYEIVWGNGYEVRSFGDRFKGGIEHYIKWMKPKIKEARRVLKETGSLYLHCDAHANYKLRALLDDAFGKRFFKGEIIWYRYNKLDDKRKIWRKFHDTVFCYSKSENMKWNILTEGTGEMVKRKKMKKTKGKICNMKEDVKYERQKCLTRSVIDNIPDISMGNSKEKIYKTQKPEKLIERFIKTSSDKGDMVLDFFGGGGTTAKVCAALNRRFIIGDVSPVAVRVTADRLLYHGCADYEIKGLLSAKKEYLKMNPHQFADMICEIKGWKPNRKKSGDRGIDGFADNGNIPIQIKNHKSKTGRPDIQKFLGAINKYEKGFFVSWDFSSEANEFKASIKDKQIELLKVKYLLNGLLIPDEISKKHKRLYDERVNKAFEKEAVKATPAEAEKRKKQIQKTREKGLKKGAKLKSSGDNS